MEKDINQIAFQAVQKATEEPSKDDIKRVMAHIGRKGGLKGGKARKDALSPKRRKEIAKKAAKKRWEKRPN
jgi:hypothetical protein